jgi:ectoine hydroxylase-related dioxygenase (phytanoyl-CoA dioxygenase family)
MERRRSVATTISYQLSKEEVLRFREQGYLGPYEAFSPVEIDLLREAVFDRVLQTDSPLAPSRFQSRHLDQPVVYDLCTHPAIVERITGLLGRDLILWRSNLFVKEPGGKEIPWHQDINYWPIEPPLNVTAWMALDDVTTENSCVQLIPGSHTSLVPHVSVSPDAGVDPDFAEMADPAYVDTGNLVNMELRPGQFFLFTEKVLHHSDPNRSGKRRAGLAIRVTVPFVKVDHARMFPGHRVVVISGEDRFGLNDVGSPPVS